MGCDDYGDTTAGTSASGYIGATPYEDIEGLKEREQAVRNDQFGIPEHTGIQRQTPTKDLQDLSNICLQMLCDAMVDSHKQYDAIDFQADLLIKAHHDFIDRISIIIAQVEINKINEIANQEAKTFEERRRDQAERIQNWEQNLARRQKEMQSKIIVAENRPPAPVRKFFTT